MTKNEYISKFVELDNLFDMMVATDNENAMDKIGEEIMSLHLKMSQDLTEQEAFEVCVLLEARDRDKKEFGF